MIKKPAALCCIALTMGTVAAGPANAKTTSDPASGWVAVGGHAKALAADVCSYSVSYEQRIVVDGKSDMMPVAFVVSPGRYEAIVYDTTCDGYIVYAFGSCLCNLVFVKAP